MFGTLGGDSLGGCWGGLGEIVGRFSKLFWEVSGGGGSDEFERKNATKPKTINLLAYTRVAE